MTVTDVTPENILRVLGKVEDPELGISIVELGLVYRVEVREGTIEVDFTLTYPGCPLGGQIEEEVVEVLARAFGLEVKARVVFSPPWSPERMSEEARVGLGYPI